MGKAYLPKRDWGEKPYKPSGSVAFPTPSGKCLIYLQFGQNLLEEASLIKHKNNFFVWQCHVLTLTPWEGKTHNTIFHHTHYHEGSTVSSPVCRAAFLHMGDDDAVRGPLWPSASCYLDSQPVRALQDVHLPYAATFSLRENVQKVLQFGFGTPREGWEGMGGSYLAPCCPSPHTCIAQAILVLLPSFAMLAAVQAKKAERRRQHKAGSARRSFLAGVFAAFLSHAEALNALILPGAASGLKPLRQNSRMSCAGLQRSKTWFKGNLEHQVVQLLLQQGPDSHHTAALPSPEGFAGFET